MEFIMIFADMHCDSLLTVSSERGLISEYNTAKNHPFFQLFAAFVPFGARPCEARRRELMKHFNVYAYECERLGIGRIGSVRELIFAEDNRENAAMFSVEGGGGLLADSEELFTLHRAGLRVMGMVWDSNELGSGAFDKCDTGLSDEGVRMAKRCAELGIVMDASHLSDKSFYDLAEVYPLPVIATHSNFRDVADNKRNLTLDMADIIAKRGGVIGLNLYPDFVKEGGAKIEDILPHVEYCLSNFGENVLGFGFDIDGTDGIYPKGVTTSSSIHEQVAELLLKHYSDSVVRKIAGENVIGFFKGIL